MKTPSFHHLTNITCIHWNVFDYLSYRFETIVKAIPPFPSSTYALLVFFSSNRYCYDFEILWLLVYNYR